jgi:hypothetical protein
MTYAETYSVTPSATEIVTTDVAGATPNVKRRLIGVALPVAITNIWLFLIESKTQLRILPTRFAAGYGYIPLDIVLPAGAPCKAGFAAGSTTAGTFTLFYDET